MGSLDTILITVLGRTGNGCDALIGCGACGTWNIPLHFQAPAGKALLSGARLWQAHCETCLGENVEIMNVALSWEDGRFERLRFTRATRVLEQIAA